MGVEARHGIRWRRIERVLGLGAHAELTDVHAEEFMARQSVIHIVRHRAEILTDDLHPVAMGFQAQNRVVLLGAMVNVKTFGGAEAVGHPKDAMQAHHMIDAQHRGVRHVVAQALPVVAVTLAPDGARMLRRKSPVLTFDEEPVGGRAPGRFQRE